MAETVDDLSAPLGQEVARRSRRFRHWRIDHVDMRGGGVRREINQRRPHRLNMFGRRAATAADDGHAQFLDHAAGIARHILGTRRIKDPIIALGRPAGVRLARQARARLGLPAGRKLVVYTGKIYWGYREVDHILEAARRVAGEVEFVMVGGRADHIERYREYIAESGIANVSFVGFVPPSQVQYYQLAADLLLLYYPTGIALNRYRSPGKIFCSLQCW